jgi:hypothetical protein
MAVGKRDRAILALHDYDGLRAAMAPDAVNESGDPRPVIAHFKTLANQLEGALDVEAAREIQRLDEGEAGRSKAERAYLQWCLGRRLFLCAINHLGPHLAAATDDLIQPGISEAFGERPGDYSSPPIIGFFSQTKQEYASARYMLFEGTNSTRVHFSDRYVALTDTLDYLLYSFASERVRTAFRIANSLLDKIAFLVDRYWKLDKVQERISFKNVWIVENKPGCCRNSKIRRTGYCGDSTGCRRSCLTISSNRPRGRTPANSMRSATPSNTHISV